MRLVRLSVVLALYDGSAHTRNTIAKDVEEALVGIIDGEPLRTTVEGWREHKFSDPDVGNHIDPELKRADARAIEAWIAAASRAGAR